MVDLLEVPAGYDYHAPKIDVPPRVFWLNRLFRLTLALLFAALAWFAHGTPNLQRVAIAIITLQDANPALYILIVCSSLGIYPVHEALHGLGGYLYGLNVRFGWDWYSLSPFVTTYGRPQTRFETVFVTIMPFLSLTLVLVPAVVAFSGLAAAVFLPALLINTLGSSSDFNTVWKMAHLPAGSLLENDRDERTAYYVPS
ncbi:MULTISPECIES: DUF3267 domain-containing protein [Halococcus]|uniref:Zincin peptidase n=1 Tax=Halococcus saccharolyticus DSM 5350 TaxID=1227455 RepID=M0ME05_9EURY|nr:MULTISPECIES: DUF3267 domain-containing protein [Halococcus]EMA43538.1 hypothetical protein C449_13292 [Halococcus saccharolyticus DSM 5350]